MWCTVGPRRWRSGERCLPLTEVTGKSCPEAEVAAAGIFAVGPQIDRLSKHCFARRNRRVVGLAGFEQGQDPFWGAFFAEFNQAGVATEGKGD